jgi:hypothetical protein
MHAAAVVHDVAPRAATQQTSTVGLHDLRPHAICGAPPSVGARPSTALSVGASSVDALSLDASLSPDEPEPEDAPLPEVAWEPDALILPDDAVPLAEVPVLEEPEAVDEPEPPDESSAFAPEEPLAASSGGITPELDPLQPTATATPSAIDAAETFRRADVERPSIFLMISRSLRPREAVGSVTMVDSAW